jgi:uncharacterized protein YpbB
MMIRWFEMRQHQLSNGPISMAIWQTFAGIKLILWEQYISDSNRTQNSFDHIITNHHIQQTISKWFKMRRLSAFQWANFHSDWTKTGWDKADDVTTIHFRHSHRAQNSFYCIIRNKRIEQTISKWFKTRRLSAFQWANFHGDLTKTCWDIVDTVSAIHVHLHVECEVMLTTYFGADWRTDEGTILGGMLCYTDGLVKDKSSFLGSLDIKSTEE